MNHTYNIAAFTPGAGEPPLRRLYCRLVVLELRLKDAAGAWTAGHDVPSLLRDLPTATTTLGSYSNQLQFQLGGLWCTSKNGSRVPVKADRFPDLRYFRHVSNDPAGSTEPQIVAVLDLLDDVEAELDAVFRSAS